jgi:uncharacterized membrane protein YkvA (DUF1232 family)
MAAFEAETNSHDGWTVFTTLEWAKMCAKRLKTDVLAIYLAAGDPRTPWQLKVLALMVTAYAFSPIDLIPDFIPVLGYLDDLIIVPLGVYLVVMWMPPDLMDEYRIKARGFNRPGANWIAGALIICIWCMTCAWLVMCLSR